MVTPLMQHWWDQACTPAKARTVDDKAGVLTRFEDVHCFDLTAECDLLKETALRIAQGGGIDPDKFYWPARRTWIEFREEGLQSAVLVDAESDNPECLASVSSVFFGVSGPWPEQFRTGSWAAERFEVLVAGSLKIWEDAGCLVSDRSGVLQRVMRQTFLAAALMMINTPTLFKRHDRAIPRQARRQAIRLNRAYPLLAWSEVRIDPCPTRATTLRRGGSTGLRPLHWCKAHKRVLFDGQRISVVAHWRGDGALGLKQQRHVIKRRGRK